MKPIDIKFEDGIPTMTKDEFDSFISQCLKTQSNAEYNFGEATFIDASRCGAKSANNLAITLQDINQRMTYSEHNKKNAMLDQIVKVIFNNPATIVIWANGDKTIVKCDGEKFDPEKGLAMAITKYLLGNNQGYYYDIFKKWLPNLTISNNI